MRIVFKAERTLYTAAVPEFFVTHLGIVQVVTPSTVALALCRNDLSYLRPTVRIIWPIENMCMVNPDLARKCMGATLC